MKPKFIIGDWVSVAFQGKVEGVGVTVAKELCVIAMKANSGTEFTWIEYGLSSDPCQPYHYGKDVEHWKLAEQMTITKTPNAYK